VVLGEHVELEGAAVIEASEGLEARSLTLLALDEMWMTMDSAGRMLVTETMENNSAAVQTVKLANATTWAATVMNLSGDPQLSHGYHGVIG
jgi:hypothetical protein